MNEKQKKVLIAIAAVVLGMLLYPPFQVRWRGGAVLKTGYGWIFAPDPEYAATVDIGLLITQWIAVLIVGGIAYFMLKDR
jgi:hypothetical protein